MGGAACVMPAGPSPPSLPAVQSHHCAAPPAAHRFRPAAPQQAAFPSTLDPCLVLGAWGAVCTFLLTTLVLAVSERRARAE